MKYEIVASFQHGTTETQLAADGDSAMEIAESYWLRPDCEHITIHITTRSMPSIRSRRWL